MLQYTILGTPLYEFYDAYDDEPTETDLFARVDEEDKILEEHGLSRTNRTEYVIHFFDSVFFNEQTTSFCIDEAIEVLAIKDGIDIVRFDNGNIGFIAYYNGHENGFEILREVLTMTTFTKGNIVYTVIDKIDDYTIIHREVNFQPWIVAYGFDKKSNSWIQGYYCNTLESAIYTAKKGNLWSKDLNFKDGEIYLIAIKRKTDGRLGMSPEEWVETREAEYITSSNKFYYYDEYEDYYIPETEILAAIPIADPDYLLD